MKSKILTDNLQALASLETDFREEYNDRDLIKEINLYKKSLAFFINNQNLSRALYESNALIKRLIHYLVDWYVINRSFYWMLFYCLLFR